MTEQDKHDLEVKTSRVRNTDVGHLRTTAQVGRKVTLILK